MGDEEVQAGREASEEASPLGPGDDCPSCEDGSLFRVYEGVLSCDSCGTDIFTTEEDE